MSSRRRINKYYSNSYDSDNFFELFLAFQNLSDRNLEALQNNCKEAAVLINAQAGPERTYRSPAIVP
jgi:hypothetical protein